MFLHNFWLTVTSWAKILYHILTTGVVSSVGIKGLIVSGSTWQTHTKILESKNHFPDKIQYFVLLHKKQERTLLTAVH